MTTISFNGKPVGYVMIEIVVSHLESEECTKIHDDWGYISSYEIIHNLISNHKEYPMWENVVALRFVTDATFVYSDALDSNGNVISSQLIPINRVEKITVEQTEPIFEEEGTDETKKGEKAHHWDSKLKKSLK
jgi:hypothetical protein